MERLAQAAARQNVRALGFLLRRGRSTVAEAAETVAPTAVSVPSSSSTAPAGRSTSDLVKEPEGELQVPEPTDLVSQGPIGITFRGPIESDVQGGGARYASAVSTLWSNIPPHVRASFTAPANLADAPKGSAPAVLDGVFSGVKALVASTGLAPAGWAESEAPTEYYNGQIELAPYRKGQTAAYNYPKILVPRELAFRFPLDMYVDPVFQTSDPAQRIRMRSFTLFPRLQGKTTLLFVFSGQPLSGLWTGLRRWLELVGSDFRALPTSQVYRLHAEEGWLNRRTHALTKFQLRRQVEEDELWSTFVYRGSWKWDYVRALHLYNKELPVVLLLDSFGYVRWHAVGLPTDEATAVFQELSRKLGKEKS